MPCYRTGQFRGNNYWGKMNVIAFVLPSPIGPWWRAEWDPSGMALRPLDLTKQKMKAQTQSRCGIRGDDTFRMAMFAILGGFS